MESAFNQVHKPHETHPSIEDEIDIIIEDLPSEIGKKWSKRFEEARQDSLPALLEELNHFTNKRNQALAAMPASFEGSKHRMIDSESMRETLNEIESRDDLFINDGKTAHVFLAINENEKGLCYKLVKNFEEYQAWNSIDKEARFLEILEDLVVDGARVPVISRLIDLPDTKAIVMEYIHGPSVDQYINGHGPVVENFNLEVFMKKLEAYVSAMHERNIFHRDLHSGNVLIGPDSTPYVIDFGRSAMAFSQETAYEHWDSTGQNRIVLKSDDAYMQDIKASLQYFGSKVRKSLH
jgi:serine/threonine protein kinase